MSFLSQTLYDAAAHFSFDSTLVEVSAGVIRLKDLGGAVYSTANPAIDTQHQIQVSALSGMTESKSVAGSDQVKYQLLVNGIARYFDTGASSWKTSDGSYAQSNTAAEINSNASTLASGLSLSAPFYLRLRALLHSNDGTTRPSLTSTTLTYTNVYGAPVAIAECLIYGYLSDLLGDLPAYDATKPVTFWVKNSHSFFHGSKFIRPTGKSAAFNSNGYMELSVIETETPGEFMEFSLTYYEGNHLKSVKLVNAIVPNQPTLPLSQITVTKDTDY